MIFMSFSEAIMYLLQIVTFTQLCMKKEWGCKGVQSQHHDANVIAAVIGEKAHLETKRHWLVKNQVSSHITQV